MQVGDRWRHAEMFWKTGGHISTQNSKSSNFNLAEKIVIFYLTIYCRPYKGDETFEKSRSIVGMLKYTNKSGLRSRVVLGAKYLVYSHILSSILSLIAAIVFSKFLGVHDFAIYALCLSLSTVLRVVCRAGVNVRLLTKFAEPSAKEYEVALAIMLSASVIFCSISIVLLPFIEGVSNTSQLFWPGLVSILLVPLYVTVLPATTRLERKLQFGTISRIEIVSQAMGLVVGSGLALAGFGIWGPLTSWFVRETFSLLYSWHTVGLVPRFQWRKRLVFGIVWFGISNTLATALFQGRGFVLLSVIGRFFGQEAVGYMGLCIRAASLIAPFRVAASRVMLPTFATVRDGSNNPNRLLGLAANIELLSSIPIAVVAVWFYEPCVRMLLGPAWVTSITFFPWAASGVIVAATHSLALTALHARGHFAASMISSLVLYATYAFVLSALSTFGLAIPAMVIVLVWPAFWVQDYFCLRLLGTEFGWHRLLWCAAGIFSCLAWIYGYLLLVLAIVIFFFTRNAIAESINALRDK
jgi:O-antigen/teichoic acid export membrane protein